eukprot:9341212-Pyramimonas_sp.AAC.1
MGNPVRGARLGYDPTCAQTHGERPRTYSRNPRAPEANNLSNSKIQLGTATLTALRRNTAGNSSSSPAPITP